MERIAVTRPLRLTGGRVFRILLYFLEHCFAFGAEFRFIGIFYLADGANLHKIETFFP